MSASPCEIAAGWDDIRVDCAERDPPLWPMSVEVRDDQIYGWQEPPS
jgi:hypothetical protein